MSFFNNFKKRVSEEVSSTCKVVSEKSRQFMEDIEAKESIATAEEDLNAIKLSIADSVYASYKKGDHVTPFITMQCKKIDELNGKITELNDAINANKGLKRCSSCGEFIPNEDSFCKNCGSSNED